MRFHHISEYTRAPAVYAEADTADNVRAAVEVKDYSSWFGRGEGRVPYCADRDGTNRWDAGEDATAGVMGC